MYNYLYICIVKYFSMKRNQALRVNGWGKIQGNSKMAEVGMQC